MRTYSLFLLMLAPSLLSAATVSERYRKFVNQHVFQSGSQVDCDNEIRTRVITGTTSTECKWTNTFIKAGINEIKKVCNRAGTPFQNSANLRVSLQPFPIVTCKRRSNRAHPDCEYNGVYSPTVYIVIGCDQGLPVHYDRYVI